MNDPIVVDVGWYSLVVDPEKVLINMNLSDFKKMLRICCRVLEDYTSQMQYLAEWEEFLVCGSYLNKELRAKRRAAVQERRRKL